MNTFPPVNQRISTLDARPDPARFSVLIWGNQRANFPSAPETLYQGKTLCVTGKIVT